MRFVETNTLEQQSCLILHRIRHLFIRQQTVVINAIRVHLAECHHGAILTCTWRTVARFTYRELSLPSGSSQVPP